MIVSFNGKATQDFARTGRTKHGWQSCAAVALRKLDQLMAAKVLTDLAAPPANRLEALKGNRAGQHSIRINDQWRICFIWTEVGPSDVEITHYH